MSARLPRSSRTRPPSPRDREIHRQVKVLGRRQCDVAAEVGRSPGQVSRIVKRVAAWRAAQPREEQGELPHVAQQRLSRWLAIERAEELYAQSLRLLAETARPATTTRKLKDGSVETTERDQMAARLQALKTALRASRESYELGQTEPPPEPDREADDRRRWHRVLSELVRRREAAEEAGTVPRSQCTVGLIQTLLQVLVGETICFRPGSHGPGTAFWSLAAGLVGNDATLQAVAGREPLPSDLPGAGGAEEGVAATLARYEQLTAAATAQERNMSATEEASLSPAGEDAGSDAATEGYDDQPALPSPPGTGELAPEKPADLRAQVVGSPEWKVARAKWLKARDERVRAEREQTIRERMERDEDLRQRRAAAAARNRWLDAGRVQY